MSSALRRRVTWLLGAAGASAVLYREGVRGALTVDVGIGRRTIVLGPLVVEIDAPRDLVFEVIAAPYLGSAGPASDHIEVLERGSDLVVAAHRTPTAGGLAAVTVEAVGFRAPEEVTFRLLRGPVPYVTERFALEEVDGRTRLRYEGELGTDFWAAGAAWGRIVRRIWVRTVERSLADVRQRSEARAAAQRRRSRAPS